MKTHPCHIHGSYVCRRQHARHDAILQAALLSKILRALTSIDVFCYAIMVLFGIAGLISWVFLYLF